MRFYQQKSQKHCINLNFRLKQNKYVLHFAKLPYTANISVHVTNLFFRITSDLPQFV